MQFFFTSLYVYIGMYAQRKYTLWGRKSREREKEKGMVKVREKNAEKENEAGKLQKH